MPLVGCNYSQIAKRAKAAHVQCFALLVADHNLMEGGLGTLGLTYTTSLPPQKESL